MMETAFPLLKVPKELLGTLLDQFTTMELFDLTQCSQKALKMVKENSTRQFEVSVSIEPNLVVDLRRKAATGFTESRFYWIFYNKRDPNRPEMEDLQTYSINGQCIEASRDLRYNRFRCRTLISLHELIRLAEYLGDVFNAKIAGAHIRMDVGVMEAIQSFGLFRTLRYVHFSRDQSSSFEAPRKSADVSHEEMRQLLDMFTDMECMTSIASPEDDFVYEKPIIGKEIAIWAGRWLKRNNLLDIDADRVHLAHCLLKEEDFNVFLHQWMNGSNTKLEYMRIEVEHPPWPEEVSLDMAKILDGLPVFPGWPKLEDATRYQDRQAPYHDGYDLRRESDGMLATVLLTGFSDRRDMFLFVVWHHPNPNYAFNMIVQ